MTDRYYRSTRDAFPVERYPAIEIYIGSRVHLWVMAAACFGSFAAIGMILAWRI